MATRDHIQGLLAELDLADEWVPSRLGARLLALDDVGSLDEWVHRIDGLQVGNGAIEMHRRLRADTPPPQVPGLPDHQALLLCVACLAASAVEPKVGSTCVELTERLNHQQRRQPDLIDELLLAAGSRMGEHDPFRRAIYAQADALIADRLTLHTQAAHVLPRTLGVGGSLRRLIGLEPDFSGGEWHRWARAIAGYALLAAQA